jgi:Na+-transporting NADH:ubiquinone oxidoreductase subunit NqrB
MKHIFALLAVLLVAATSTGQEITGPESAAVSQPVWLALELPEGSVGKFDSGNPAYQLDTDPAHVAAGAAMFFAVAPGEFRIVAAIVDASQAITFAEKIIVVKGSGPPNDTESITAVNVRRWLETVPAEVRTEQITHPITGEKMTRQAAVGQTFLNIGKAGTAIGSVSGLDLMLSTALVSALGDKAASWQSFASSVDGGLSKLKEQGASVADYAAAFLVIGGTLNE